MAAALALLISRLEAPAAAVYAGKSEEERGVAMAGVQAALNAYTQALASDGDEFAGNAAHGVATSNIPQLAIAEARHCAAWMSVLSSLLVTVDCGIHLASTGYPSVYTQLLAAACLTHMVDAHAATMEPRQLVTLNQTALQWYTSTLTLPQPAHAAAHNASPATSPIVRTQVVALICRIVRAGWLQAEGFRQASTTMLDLLSTSAFIAQFATGTAGAAPDLRAYVASTHAGAALQLAERMLCTMSDERASETQDYRTITRIFLFQDVTLQALIQKVLELLHVLSQWVEAAQSSGAAAVYLCPTAVALLFSRLVEVLQRILQFNFSAVNSATSKDIDAADGLRDMASGGGTSAVFQASGFRLRLPGSWSFMDGAYGDLCNDLLALTRLFTHVVSGCAPSWWRAGLVAQAVMPPAATQLSIAKAAALEGLHTANLCCLMQWPGWLYDQDGLRAAILLGHSLPMLALMTNNISSAVGAVAQTSNGLAPPFSPRTPPDWELIHAMLWMQYDLVRSAPPAVWVTLPDCLPWCLLFSHMSFLLFSSRAATFDNICSAREVVLQVWTYVHLYVKSRPCSAALRGVVEATVLQLCRAVVCISAPLPAAFTSSLTDSFLPPEAVRRTLNSNSAAAGGMYSSGSSVASDDDDGNVHARRTRPRAPPATGVPAGAMSDAEDDTPTAALDAEGEGSSDPAEPFMQPRGINTSIVACFLSTAAHAAVPYLNHASSRLLTCLRRMTTDVQLFSSVAGARAAISSMYASLAWLVCVSTQMSSLLLQDVMYDSEDHDTGWIGAAPPLTWRGVLLNGVPDVTAGEGADAGMRSARSPTSEGGGGGGEEDMTAGVFASSPPPQAPRSAPASRRRGGLREVGADGVPQPEGTHMWTPARAAAVMAHVGNTDLSELPLLLTPGDADAYTRVARATFEENGCVAVRRGLVSVLSSARHSHSAHTKAQRRRSSEGSGGSAYNKFVSGAPPPPPPPPASMSSSVMRNFNGLRTVVEDSDSGSSSSSDNDSEDGSGGGGSGSGDEQKGCTDGAAGTPKNGTPHGAAATGRGAGASDEAQDASETVRLEEAPLYGLLLSGSLVGFTLRQLMLDTPPVGARTSAGAHHRRGSSDSINGMPVDEWSADGFSDVVVSLAPPTREGGVCVAELLTPLLASHFRLLSFLRYLSCLVAAAHRASQRNSGGAAVTLPPEVARPVGAASTSAWGAARAVGTGTNGGGGSSTSSAMGDGGGGMLGAHLGEGAGEGGEGEEDATVFDELDKIGESLLTTLQLEDAGSTPATGAAAVAAAAVRSALAITGTAPAAPAPGAGPPFVVPPFSVMPPTATASTAQRGIDAGGSRPPLHSVHADDAAAGGHRSLRVDTSASRPRLGRALPLTLDLPLVSPPSIPGFGAPGVLANRSQWRLIIACSLLRWTSARVCLEHQILHFLRHFMSWYARYRAGIDALARVVRRRRELARHNEVGASSPMSLTTPSSARAAPPRPPPRAPTALPTPGAGDMEAEATPFSLAWSEAGKAGGSVGAWPTASSHGAGGVWLDAPLAGGVSLVPARWQGASGGALGSGAYMESSGGSTQVTPCSDSAGEDSSTAVAGSGTPTAELSIKVRELEPCADNIGLLSLPVAAGASRNLLYNMVHALGFASPQNVLDVVLMKVMDDLRGSGTSDADTGTASIGLSEDGTSVITTDVPLAPVRIFKDALHSLSMLCQGEVVSAGGGSGQEDTGGGLDVRSILLLSSMASGEGGALQMQHATTLQRDLLRTASARAMLKRPSHVMCPALALPAYTHFRKPLAHALLSLLFARASQAVHAEALQAGSGSAQTPGAPPLGSGGGIGGDAAMDAPLPGPRREVFAFRESLLRPHNSTAANASAVAALDAAVSGEEQLLPLDFDARDSGGSGAIFNFAGAGVGFNWLTHYLAPQAANLAACRSLLGVDASASGRVDGRQPRPDADVTPVSPSVLPGCRALLLDTMYDLRGAMLAATSAEHFRAVHEWACEQRVYDLLQRAVVHMRHDWKLLMCILRWLDECLALRARLIAPPGHPGVYVLIRGSARTLLIMATHFVMRQDAAATDVAKTSKLWLLMLRVGARILGCAFVNPALMVALGDSSWVEVWHAVLQLCLMQRAQAVVHNDAVALGIANAVRALTTCALPAEVAPQPPPAPRGVASYTWGTGATATSLSGACCASVYAAGRTPVWLEATAHGAARIEWMTWADLHVDARSSQPVQLQLQLGSGGTSVSNASNSSAWYASSVTCPAPTSLAQLLALPSSAFLPLVRRLEDVLATPITSPAMHEAVQAACASLGTLLTFEFELRSLVKLLDAAAAAAGADASNAGAVKLVQAAVHRMPSGVKVSAAQARALLSAIDAHVASSADRVAMYGVEHVPGDGVTQLPPQSSFHIFGSHNVYYLLQLCVNAPARAVDDWVQHVNSVVTLSVLCRPDVATDAACLFGQQVRTSRRVLVRMYMSKWRVQVAHVLAPSSLAGRQVCAAHLGQLIADLRSLIL